MKDTEHDRIQNFRLALANENILKLRVLDAVLVRISIKLGFAGRAAEIEDLSFVF